MKLARVDRLVAIAMLALLFAPAVFLFVQRLVEGDRFSLSPLW